MFNREKLSEYLKKNKITQLGFARMLGVTEGAVRHIVVGIKQPSLDMTVRIAKLMGCTVNDLVIIPEGE